MKAPAKSRRQPESDAPQASVVTRAHRLKPVPPRWPAGLPRERVRRPNIGQHFTAAELRVDEQLGVPPLDGRGSEAEACATKRKKETDPSVHWWAFSIDQGFANGDRVVSPLFTGRRWMRLNRSW